MLLEEWGGVELHQVSPGVDGGHGGSYGFSPIAEALRAPIPPRSSGHAILNSLVVYGVPNWEAPLHAPHGSSSFIPPLTHPTFHDASRCGQGIDVTGITPQTCGLA